MVLPIKFNNKIELKKWQFEYNYIYQIRNVIYNIRS